jgi:hypothetical protein
MVHRSTRTFVKASRVCRIALGSLLLFLSVAFGTVRYVNSLFLLIFVGRAKTRRVGAIFQNQTNVCSITQYGQMHAFQYHAARGRGVSCVQHMTLPHHSRDMVNTRIRLRMQHAGCARATRNLEFLVVRIRLIEIHE